MSKPHSKTLSGLTVNQRLWTLGGAALVGFGLVVGVGWWEGSRADSALDHASELQLVSNDISAMRVSGIRLVLAAMDSIVDKNDKVISPERLTLISKLSDELNAGVAKVQALALSLGKPELAQTYPDDLAEVTKAIRVDLKALIEAGAAEEEFGKIDDAIDGAGERTTGTLQTLFDEGSAQAQQQIHRAQQLSTESLLVQIVIGFAALAMMMVMLAIHGGSLRKGIMSVRNSMMKILDGDFDSPVAATSRGDEIGQMARSTEMFRLAAIDKVRLESIAAADREMTEQERQQRDAQKQIDEKAIRFAVETLGANLTKLADGDMTARIDQDFRSDLQKLRNDFNLTVERLGAVLEEVRGNSASVQASGNQIRLSTDDLARRTEQQAASLEQTASALQEITMTMKSSTQRVGEASQLVEGTKLTAQKSGAVVADAMAAMERIENASAEIGKIINVVEEIAFQTNLLALNAGVEAARAGEAGKGFAVVAQEVRELAGRASGAAKTIKQLVAKSSEEVKTGVELVEATGEVLRSIGDDVIAINDHVLSFSQSAKEQFIGLGEITSAMSQMDQSTQKNATMVEETTTVTQTLSSDADRLAQLVGQFVLPGSAHQSYVRQSAASSAPAAMISKPASLPSSKPKPAATGTNPVASPARALMGKIAGAYKNTGSAMSQPTATSENWEEF